MTSPEIRQDKPGIPLEARMSFINWTQVNLEWVNAKTIASDIGTNDRWIFRTVKEFGIQSEVKIVDGVKMSAYPHWTIDILREELQWREHVRELPDELGVTEIAESLGRSIGWTQKTLDGIEARPIRKSGPARYGKRHLKELRHISMAVPLDDGWYNLRQLSELTGQDRDWVERRVLEAGCEPMERRSALTGRIYDYFPQEALDAVKRAIDERAPPAGEWITVAGMAYRLNRGEKWVLARIAAFGDMSEMRQDDNGVPRTHYPPFVLSNLGAESEGLKQLPERGDYLNIHEIARSAGHATPWAEKLLSQLGIEPELRKDRRGRVQVSYPPSTVQLLLDHENENRTHEKGVTFNDIWDLQIAVGSLKSQIRLKQGLDKALKQHGVSDTDGERQLISEDLGRLRHELKLAALRLYRLEAKADQQKAPHK